MMMMGLSIVSTVIVLIAAVVQISFLEILSCAQMNPLMTPISVFVFNGDRMTKRPTAMQHRP